MADQLLKIWSNTRFPAAALAVLREGVGRHELLWAAGVQDTNLAAGGPDAALADADVAFGQPDVQAALRSPRLRWIHLTTAGYERFDRPEVRAACAARGLLVTNASGVYAEPVAQHVLAMMLGLARRLPQSFDNQRGPRLWPYNDQRSASRLLCGETALLLGFGAIGRRLAELLAPLHMDVIAVRRHVRGDEPIRTVPDSQVETVLPGADHIINLLPGGEATRNFVNAARLALTKPGAIFYNAGRGTTVDQDALIAALKSGQLAAAYLDVMTPEPLPPDHPLWTIPNCFITPHTAGGHADEYPRHARHFLANLRRFLAGEGLADRVI